MLGVVALAHEGYSRACPGSHSPVAAVAAVIAVPLSITALALTRRSTSTLGQAAFLVSFCAVFLAGLAAVGCPSSPHGCGQ